MHTETHQKLLFKKSEIAAELASISTTLDKLAQDRAALTIRLVGIFLHALNPATRQRLHSYHPKFLTPERAALFLRFMKILWIFKPVGYARALVDLQTQFRLYLDTCGRFVEEDKQFKQLSLRQCEAIMLFNSIENELRIREMSIVAPHSTT